MESFLLRKKTSNTYIESIAAYAFSSRASYRSVLHRLEEFVGECYEGRAATDVVNELKSIPAELRDEAFSGLLQDCVNWLLRRNLSHRTVNNHYKVIKHYFSYNGIRADPIVLRHNVNRPREIKEKLHPLTLEEVHKIFQNAIGWRRVLYLVLTSSGMRIRECVSLRKRNFDLNSFERIKVDIPAQFTKTKTAHTTFLSKEAEHHLLPRLNSLKSDDLVFARNQDPYHASMTEIEAFIRYRDAAGLTDKYESANRHHITLHSFRSYFFTRARRVHDTDIAHAMVGHTPYLDMYDRKDDAEKLQLYLELEPTLKIGFEWSADCEEMRLFVHRRRKPSEVFSTWIKLQNEMDFRARIASRQGFVVVTDKKKGSKIHRADCGHLRPNHFLEKVVKLKSKNGSYYWYEESKGLELTQFSQCKFCLS